LVIFADIIHFNKKNAKGNSELISELLNYKKRKNMKTSPHQTKFIT